MGENLIKSNEYVRPTETESRVKAELDQAREANNASLRKIGSTLESARREGGQKGAYTRDAGRRRNSRRSSRD
jgi:hypothetical protein